MRGNSKLHGISIFLFTILFFVILASICPANLGVGECEKDQRQEVNKEESPNAFQEQAG